MSEHPVVLCIQDTTERNYNLQQITGLGPLSYETQRDIVLAPDLCGDAGTPATGRG